MRIRRFIIFYGWLLLLMPGAASAQSLKQVAETSSFTDYEIDNQFLQVLPAHTLLMPAVNGAARYEVLEQAVATVLDTLPDSKKTALNLPSDTSQVVQLLPSGFFRGREVVPAAIHLARTSAQGLRVTRNLKIRVYKNTGSLLSSKTTRQKTGPSPLAEGNWYKIPVSKNGIYKLDAAYLAELGMDINSVNPKNIQLWGMGGRLLPEANSAPKPEFKQIPILVEGEDNGQFDADDRILFFANSPDAEYVQNGEFVHQIHPYSSYNYVFLTVGSAAGLRLSTVNNAINPVKTVTAYNDFIWKEEELVKAEAGLRSGREWLGQTINATRSGSYVSIFSDTLAGLVPGAPVQVSGQIYGRSLGSMTMDIRLNGTAVAALQTAPIQDFNNSEGPTARPASFSAAVTPPAQNGILNLELRANHNAANDQVFIDWLRITAERELLARNGYLYFNTEDNPGNTEEVRFMLKGFSSRPVVMDVTDPVRPALLRIEAAGDNYELNYYNGSNLKIIAQSDFSVPLPGKAVKNQNVQEFPVFPDYLIITSAALESRAKELAAWRESQGLTPLVVTQEEILNEFSGGLTDPSALRNFIKHLWDTSIAEGGRQLKYLLLFGDTTYDPKGIITDGLTNHVLTYESKESVSREGTYGTDDYFGYLDDNEGDFGSGNTSNSFLMDIGIGRIPVQTAAEAGVFIQKLKTYENPENAGTWQSQLAFAADDDNPNQSEKDLHVYNADVSAELMNVDEPGIRIKKIYEFSYPAEITGSGYRVPEAARDFMKTINQGTLALSYSGHGNEQVLSDEHIFRADRIPEFTNINKLTTLITVTCQFGRYDDTGEQSGAEKFVLAPNGGGIAAFTTTRVVYTSAYAGSNSNFALSIALSQRLTERNPDGTGKRLGDIAMQTKNSIIDGTNIRIGSSLNNKKFILLGDPAAVFQLPPKKSVITEINGKDVTALSIPDTVRALDIMEISGFISDGSGNTLSDFNGETTLTIYDARRPVRLPERPWIDNPATDCRLDNCSYLVENDMLFKGKASVTNGFFTLPAIIPKDISSSETAGRILVYARTENSTASGSFAQIIFNGVNPDAVNDGTGPDINLYLNDKSFINGTLVNSSPVLYVELEDESGINTSGTGVGHEIIATIDTKPQQTIILNEYFEGNLNSYTGGRIEYPLDQLPEGSYTLKVRAWDVHNNPSENEIYFEVAEEAELAVRNIYNYPNPMNNRTSFTFEHNQPGNPLDISVKIYTLSGKPVQQLQESIITPSNYASISWDGRDRDYDRLGNGTYIYVLRVTANTPKGRQSTEKIEKLVIIR